MKEMMRQSSKTGGPSGDHTTSASAKAETKTSNANLHGDANSSIKDKTKNDAVKKTTSKSKDRQKEKSQTKKPANDAEREKREKERRDRERREWERYQRDVIEAERKEKELEFERWEREEARERERARRGKVPNAVSRYKPRKPPAGYKDPHEACKQVLPTKVKEEKRQEIKALMNCIAFDEEAPSADGDKPGGKVKSTMEEMDHSMSSDTTSDMTDVTPRSSSSGCSSMSKQSVNYEKTEMSKKEKSSEASSKRNKSKNESEVTVPKKKDAEKGKGDNQETETEVGNEAELEEMKYLEDAFEDLDIDDQATDFASSIITGLSEERRAKCGRKNMTFTNEQLREIERVNLILLKKIMGQKKPRMKSQSQPPSNRRTSAAINRSRMEERIERENKILLKKLQSAKGTTGSQHPDMKPKYALEDLIFETEARGAETGVNNEEMDVYAQLQQKDKDLILAAELGKALLEKNEELTKQLKEVTEESSKKIEILEQERHISRRKLESLQEECDSKVAELQGDISELRKNLDFRENYLKQIERDKGQLIEDLTAQNQRLKEQLKERGRTEENLTHQLSSLRDQCNLKKSSLQDHASNLEILRDEIQMLGERKQELERRLQFVTEERDALSASLEESMERIHVLERHTREQDLQIRSTSRELERIRAANVTLGERLEAMNSLDSPRSRSLLHEMECDDDFHSPTYSSLEKEVIANCETLRGICQYLKNRTLAGSEGSSDQSMYSDFHISTVKVGMLTSIVEELDSLLHLGEGRNSGLDSGLETRIEIELHQTKEALERVDKDLAEKNEELKARAELIIDLTGKLTLKEAELKRALEEKEIAKSDLAKISGNPEDLLSEAREARDAAISRKGELELQLARVRIDLLQVNSQLMEAVQQKVELSQQLEQWQVDMQCLLDEQMRAKLTKHEKKRAPLLENQSNASQSSGPRRILSLFR